MTRFKNMDGNCKPRSEKTFKGSLCKYQIYCINKSAKSLALTLERQETMCLCLVRQSTTTVTASNTSDHRRLVTKFMAMLFQRLWGIGNDINTPYGACLGVQICWQIKQLRTNLSTSFLTPGQNYLCLSSYNIFNLPGYPATGALWWSCKRHSLRGGLLGT